MASAATTTLQMAIIAAATHYLVQPQPYYTASNFAAEQTQRAIKDLAQSDAARLVAEAIQNVLTKLPERMRPAIAGSLKDEQSRGGASADDPSSNASSSNPKTFGGDKYLAKPEGGKTKSGAGTSAAGTAPKVLISSSSSTSDAPSIRVSFFHKPANLYGDQGFCELPSLKQAEVDRILDAISKRRKARHGAMQRRVQRYRTGGLSPVTEPPKKKPKKTVRFTLDTKPGSSENPTKPEDKLLSPLPPAPDSELAHFSASLAFPDGSVFTHPYDFDEADFIRRLPSRMKNGAGGLAWCRGRTEQGLYMLDTPVKRLLLDLRAGVCYDGGSGRVMGVEEVLGCMLWGRGEVEERWGGFRWRRGLSEK